MNSLAVFIPIVAIMASAFVLTSILRYRLQRHSALSGNLATSGESSRHIELLASENDKLNGQINRLEERIAVLERIVTDPAERTAREIESLRLPKN